MKILLDTCVILDVLQKRQGLFNGSYKVLLGAVQSKYDAYITASSVTDIYYIYRNSKNIKEKDNAWQIAMNKLSDIFEIIGVLTVTEQICRQALKTGLHDYEDAVAVETALSSDVDCIITRNLKDFTNSPIPVYSPEHFLELHQ